METTRSHENNAGEKRPRQQSSPFIAGDMGQEPPLKRARSEVMVHYSYGTREVKETFANRETETARLFALNARNNWKAGFQEHQPCVGLSVHLYGAGKTTFGDAYLGQLKRGAVKAEVKKELERMVPKAGRGSTPSLLDYGMDQLDEMSKEQVVHIAINAADETFSATMASLHFWIDYMTGKDPCRVEDHGKHNLYRINAIRTQHPVYLVIDEIGRMPYPEFQKLKSWLALLHVGHSSVRPFHAYVCGRPPRKEASGRGLSCPVSHEILFLQPLAAAHISKIAKNDYKMTEDVLPMAMCEVIAWVTAGVARLVRYMLERMPRPISREVVVETAQKIASDSDNSADFVRLRTTSHLLAFARFVAMEEMGYELDVKPIVNDESQPDPLTELLGILPVLAERQDSGLFRIRCCPMYFTVLREELSQLDIRSILLDDPHSSKHRGDGQQSEVLTYLQQQLMPRLLTERAPLEGSWGSPLTTSLMEWMPALFRRDDEAGLPNPLRSPLISEALWSAAAEKEVEQHLAQPLAVYFKPRMLAVKFLREGTSATPRHMWATVSNIVGEKGGAVMMMPGGQSYAPDILVHLPADSGPLRLVSFLEKTMKGSSECRFGFSDLSDEVAKLPRDMPHGSTQLLVVVADNTSSALEEAIGEQFLVLAKGVGEDGRDCVISNGEPITCQGGNDVQGRVGEATEAARQTVDECLLKQLASCLAKLPIGATVAVMNAQLLRKYFPKERSN